jgi:predicted TIM-barrel fold metal-dependent hydrolase
MMSPLGSSPAGVWLLVATLALSGCATGPRPQRLTDQPPYTMADFATVRKFDAHVHANADSDAFIDQARADGFELLSINVDYGDFPAIARQAVVAQALAKRAPETLHYAATFSMQGWGTPGWADRVQGDIADARAKGALAVKTWKNIGMAVRDARGQLVMIDDIGFDPVIARIEALGMPMIGHQGEPYNCWLPLDKMTTNNDREYFAAHPQYHMFLQPEMPSYEDQMRARDRMLTRHPRLRFIGAHMASLEWSVDRLARFLDEHPQASVDLAARMTQVQYQSVRDREKVRTFFIRYQDRLIYGSDLAQAPDANLAEFRAEAHSFWTSHWRYLATPESQRIDDINADVPGLALPRNVIDKLYWVNARKLLRLPTDRQAIVTAQPSGVAGSTM